MQKIKQFMSALMAFTVVAVAAVTTSTSIKANAEDASATATYSVKEYAPTTADELDFFGVMSDINGGGVSTFAHAGLTTPLDGDNISLDTSFTLLPQTTTDGWLTYSFTTAPVAADSQIPNHAANSQGIFFHITNYSSTSAPNCVEVQFVQNNGSNAGIASSVFLDNAVGEKINFSLAKQSDETYTWTITRLSDNANLKTITGLAFNESLFVNENGQTYFSTALYGSENGNAAANRNLSVYGVDAYSADVSADCVTLSQTEYRYEEGGVYTPDVEVTVGGETLVKDKDYTVAYQNNTTAGTAKAIVSFRGALSGNVIEKEFVIKQTYSLTVNTGDPDAMQTYALLEGETLPTIEAPTATGKTFTGWVDAEGNAISELPTVMPAENIELYASWTLDVYTLKITYADNTSEDIKFAVEADADNGIKASTELAEVLASKLPANTEEYTYAWAEEVPETFALQNYTFTVVATEVSEEQPVTYTLTIHYADNTSEEIKFAVEADPDNGIKASTELAEILASKLPSDTEEYTYAWAEEVPETFALQDYTFTVVETEIKTEIVYNGYSSKKYVPDQYDTINYYSGVGDIDPEDGDGITTFAHIGLVTPLKGADIRLDTSFKLLSKKAEEEGGNGVDGWVTYSFAKTPADITSDGTIPSHASTADGLFIHITNYSGTTAPNCVEIQLVERLNGETVTIGTTFVDNIVDVRMHFSLVQAADGTYTLTLTKLNTEDVLYTVGNLPLNTAAFVNENGQTYFSTAIYEGEGCDGSHWEHRDVSIYSVEAYNIDIGADNVVLSQTEYTYDGSACTPDVTVTVDGKTLVNGVDYAIEYSNNNAVGTATAKVIFYGALGGNVVEKEFVINAPADDSSSEPDSSSDDSSEPASDSLASSDTTGTESSADESDGLFGCFSTVTFNAIGALLALGCVTLFAKKRK